MTKTAEWWLNYLKAHPGTVEVSTLLVDIVCHSSRQEAVHITSALLQAYGKRVITLAKE